jgi:protein TonB
VERTGNQNLGLKILDDAALTKRSRPSAGLLWPFSLFLAACIHGLLIAALLHSFTKSNSDAISSEGAGEDRLTVIAITSIEPADIFDQKQSFGSRAQLAQSQPEELKPPPKVNVAPLTGEAETAAGVQQSLEVAKQARVMEQITKPEQEKQEADQPKREASEASLALDEQRAASASSAQRLRMLNEYEIALHTAIERAKIRPHVSNRATAVVAMTISPEGTLLQRSLAASSGIPEIDSAALQSIERAAPFPPMPPEISRVPLRLTVPFEYGGR